MSNYRKIKIHTSEIDSRIIMDDVEKTDSVNPRSVINQAYVQEYKEAIIGYLASEQEFHKVWRQVPEAVETETEGEYLLISGYHTISALGKALQEIEDNPQHGVDDGVKYEDIDTGFDFFIRVYNSKNYDYRTTAKYYSAFSNVHGQRLDGEEKRQAAYNALSAMFLTKDEHLLDEMKGAKLRPFINDRKLAAMLNMGKSTVNNVRRDLWQERHGPEESEETPTETTTEAPTTESSVSNDVDALEQAHAKSTTEAKTEAKTEFVDHSGGESSKKTEPDNTAVTIPTGDANEGENTEGEGGKLSFKEIQTLSDKKIRQARDFVMELDLNKVSVIINDFYPQLEAQQQKRQQLNVGADPIEAAVEDRLYSLMITAIRCLADEAEEKD